MATDSRESDGSVELQAPHDKDATFVDAFAFQEFIGAVILLNVVVLAGETDYPELPIWPWLDNAFLLVFLVELILRFYFKGLDFLTASPAWAMLDISLVGLGILDEWLLPLAEMQGAGGGASEKDRSVFKSFRMLRMLRLLRMFKMFPKLNAFLNAQAMMMKTFVWIFFVLFIVILCCGITLTQLLRAASVEYLRDRGGVPDSSVEGLEDPSRLQAWQQVHVYFENVPRAFFALFQVTTTDNWEYIATPLITLHPMWRIFFVLFIVFMAWTMISILTAVASDSMIAATTDRKEQELKEAERKQRQFMIFLRDAFYEADTDGNGRLDRDEFQTMMEKEFVQQQMKKLGVNLSLEELQKAWDVLDVDEQGELTIDIFVSGLSYLQERLSAIHVVNVDYNLKRASARMLKRMEKVTEYLEELKRQNMQVDAWAKDQKALKQQQVVLLWLWQRWAAKRDPSALDEMVPIKAEELPEELQRFACLPDRA
mmetsp:Transcript_63183/g.150666  ORF Transcript_63183/g.150666 Transcript_63183/m.150666 type:complete len:484 (+) Transcript_63183:247-1698(+)